MTLKARLGAAFLLTSSLATPALADATSEALVRSFIEHLDKSKDWSAKAARISSSGNQTIINDLKIDSADHKLHAAFAKIALDSLALREGGGITLPAVSIEKTSLAGPSWSYTAPAFTMHGLAVPDLAGWHYEPKTPLTSLAGLYTELAKTEFTDLAIPEAALAQAIEITGVPKRNTATTYKDMRLGSMSGGILASQFIASIEQRSGPDGTAFIMEKLAAGPTDFAAFAHALDPAQYAGGKGDGIWRDMAKDISYGRVAINENGKEVFSAGPISGDRMQVRQTPEPFVPAVDKMIAMGDKPPPAEVMNLLSQNMPNMVGWLRIGSLKMANIKGNPPEGGTFAIADISLDDLSGDGLKNIALSGLDVAADQFAAKLKSFEMGDIVWPSMKAFFSIGMLEESKKQGVTDKALADQVAGEMMNAFPRIGHIALSGLAAGPAGTPPLTLDSYEATMSGDSALLPRESKANVKSLVIPGEILKSTPDTKNLFDALGYDRLSIDVDGKGSYEENGGHYANDVSLSVVDAGILKLGYGFGEFTPDRLKQFFALVLMAPPGGEPDPGAAMAVGAPITLERFTLRFEDASLTKRALAFAAKMQGVDEQTLIGNLTAMAQISLSQLRNPQFTSEAVAAIGSYLKDPRSLTFSLSPAKPVNVQQLMTLDPADPGAALTMLGASVKAND